jgi:hypothetical protein
VAGFEPKAVGVAVAKNAGFSLWYPAYVVLNIPELNGLVGVGVTVGVGVIDGVTDSSSTYRVHVLPKDGKNKVYVP